jgi:hypothetical protein
MSGLIQGDEVGILFEFLLARLRANSAGYDVEALPHDPKQQYPCYGFSAGAGPAATEQGGATLYSIFTVKVMVVGALGVNDLQPIRAAAKELHSLLMVNSADTGTRYGDGCVLEVIHRGPLHMSPRDEQGRIQHYLGAIFEIKVQPDGAHT